MKNYVSPHCHLQSLDSASTPAAFAAKEVELGTGAIVCTDHGTLGAAYATYELAKKNNLTAAIGIEAYMRQDDCPILTKLGVPKTSAVPRGSDKAKWAADHPEGSFYSYAKYFHATLGFQTFAAYKLAVKLLSKADARSEVHGSERKALFGWSEIEELAAQKVTMGSGCLVGLVGRHLMTADTISRDTKIAAAKAYFERLHYLFKDRFYVEIFPHRCTHTYIKGVFIDVEKNGKTETIKFSFSKKIKTNQGETTAFDLSDNYDKESHQELLGVCNYKVWTDYEQPYKIINVRKQDSFIENECNPWTPNGDLQFGANVFMMGMAKKHNVPIMVSDDAHFTDPKFKLIQDIRLSQQDKWDQGGSWKFYNSYHRMSSAEAFEHFNKLHNIPLKTFEEWVDNSYRWIEGFKGFEFDAKLQLPTKFFPKDTLKYTRELIDKNGRMPKNDPRYIERLKKELDILHRNGKIDLLPYFHLANEVCSLYQNQGELMNVGRGSAAGCLLSYLLGITHLDPIKHDLSLERFITKTRIESLKWPDIDLDFNSRDLLVGYATDVVEFETEDGKKTIVPENFKLETDRGLLTAREAIDKNADIKPWWNNEN